MRTTPVMTVLSMPALLLGVEPKAFFANVGMCAAMVMGFNLPAWIPVALLIHVVLVQLAKHDPKILKIYLRYKRSADRYEPWPDALSREAGRPRITGREAL